MIVIRNIDNDQQPWWSSYHGDDDHDMITILITMILMIIMITMIRKTTLFSRQLTVFATSLKLQVVQRWSMIIDHFDSDGLWSLLSCNGDDRQDFRWAWDPVWGFRRHWGRACKWGHYYLVNMWSCELSSVNCMWKYIFQVLDHQQRKVAKVVLHPEFLQREVAWQSQWDGVG